MAERSSPDSHGELPPAPRRAALRRRVMGWYRRHARVLPWRADPQREDDRGRVDPYHVLVSEAMLQQTQVATVVDYFQRFIRALPTVFELAAADEQRVLSLWQGLGYYRRARHLHRAARALVDQHGGTIPRNAAKLAALPGIGPYTAGAVASIAFQQREAVVDGNVARVLARLEAIEAVIDEPATRRHLWRLAAALLPSRRPGDFNQAMMELGATLCRPRSPACGDCPVAALCRAHQCGLERQLPRRRPRRQPQTVEHHIVAIERGGRWLLEKRPDDGLWAGMWQLPVNETLDGEPAAPALVGWVHSRYGLDIAPPATAANFTHRTTHRTIHFHLWQASTHGGRLRRGTAALWRRLDQLEDLPLANPQRCAITTLQGC